MSRKANVNRAPDELISQHSRFLTPGELTHARLRLSQQMVDLVLSERDTLPATMQTSLAGLAKMLEKVVREARRLP
jgi:hypothetical protein